MTALTLFPPCMEKAVQNFAFANYIALHFEVHLTSTQAPEFDFASVNYSNMII